MATVWDKSLGAQVSLYRGRAFPGLGRRVALVVGLLAVLAPLAYGLYRAQYASTYYGPVAARYWSRPWYLLAGCAAVLLMIWLLIRLVRSRRYVAVHQNGLRMRLSRRQQYAWSSLAGVATGTVQVRFLGIPLSNRYRAELYPVVGKSVLLDDSLEKLPELLTQIKARLYPRLLKSMRQAFEEGERVYFGPLAIQQSELRLEGKDPAPLSIPWSQVRSVNVEAGMLVIDCENNRRIRMPVARVPNLELLLQIIQTGVNP